MTQSLVVGFTSRKARRPDVCADPRARDRQQTSRRKARKPDVCADKMPIYRNAQRSQGPKARCLRGQPRDESSQKIGRKARRPDVCADVLDPTGPYAIVARPEGQMSARTCIGCEWNQNLVARPEGQMSARTVPCSFRRVTTRRKARRPDVCADCCDSRPHQAWVPARFSGHTVV